MTKYVFGTMFQIYFIVLFLTMLLKLLLLLKRNYRYINYVYT